MSIFCELVKVIFTVPCFCFRCKINLGDLQSEESRHVTMKLTIDALPAVGVNPSQHLFDARCDYFNVISKQLENKSFKLSVLRPGKTARNYFLPKTFGNYFLPEI